MTPYLTFIDCTSNVRFGSISGHFVLQTCPLYPPIADISRGDQHVRFVPIADIASIILTWSD